MSELKEHQFCESDEFFREYHGPLSNETHLYYLKSEADKVIAELEESHKKEVGQLLMEIAELKADYREACDRLQTANIIKDEQLAETRHSKYKRCLDKAKQCEEKCRGLENAVIRYSTYPYMSTCPTDCDPRYTFFKRWHERWLELAEKFKEAK